MSSTPVSVSFPVCSDALGSAQVAAWVFAPENVSDLLPPMWLVCFPGGSYRGLAYYDRQVPGYAAIAYSMARWLAYEGIGIIVVDHLGTGQSRVDPDLPGWHLTRRVYAEAYQQLMRQIRDHLSEGTLHHGLAPVNEDRLFLAGVGHSMGGALLTQLQASYSCCDAVCMLGWATLTLPAHLPGAPPAEEFATLIPPNGYILPEKIRPSARAFFYSPAVPDALIEADEQEATVMPASLLECVQPQALCEEAARIRCPVFLSFVQDADLTSTPHEEMAAYPLLSR